MKPYILFSLLIVGLHVFATDAPWNFTSQTINTGNGTAANSQRVTLASDSTGQVTANAGTNLNTSLLALQSGANTMLDRTGSGTISALNGAVTATTNGAAAVSFNVTGTWVATLTLQATVDGTNWATVTGSVLNIDTTTQSVANNQLINIASGGFSQVRLIATAYTSGTASIAWDASAGSNSQQVFSSVAASFQTTARLNDGSGNAISEGQQTMAASLPMVIASNQTAFPVNVATAATGGWTYKHITGAATTVVKSGAGTLGVLCINNGITATYTIDDNTSAAAPTIGVLSNATTQQLGCIQYNMAMTTGITIVSTGAGTDLTVGFK